jgi:hypothetical protein
MPTEIADRSGEQQRLCSRGGEKVVHEGIETLYRTEVVRTIQGRGDTKGNPEARCKRCRVYGLKSHHYSILSLCNELRVLLCREFYSTLSVVTDVA